MGRKLIRLAIVEPAEDSENKCAGFRDFVITVQQLLADTGIDLQVTYRESAGYDRIMLRLRRICPEEVVQADLVLFLFREEDDSFLSTEYEIACDAVGAGDRPVCVKVILSWEDPGRSLMYELLDLDPSLPVLIEDNGRVLINGTEVLPIKPQSYSWLDDDLYGARCPRCGGSLRRYDDWFICESCHSIG